MELMKEENAFKKHKVAVIIIIIFLSMSFFFNYNNYFPNGFGTALRTETGFTIGLLFVNVIIFFILFAIYYCVVQAFIKLRSKKKNKGKE